MCPQTWDISDGHCYHLSPTQMNFKNSEAYSKNNCADLVEVNNDAAHLVEKNMV